MIWVFISYFTLLIYLNLDQEVKEKTIESQVLQQVKKFAYPTIAKQCKHLGYDYALSAYMKEVILITLALGFVCQLTTNNMIITGFITAVYICFIPLMHLQRVQNQVKNGINQAIFSYLQTALLLLREDKTIYDILRTLEDCGEVPIKEDLQQINEYIAKTGNVSKGLMMFEMKYPNALIKNLTILMRSKHEEGTVSDQLIDYFYSNVESYELMLNDFIAKRKANRTMFYLIIVLNSFGIVLLKNFVSAQNTQLSSLMMGVILLYYLANLVTMIVYECWSHRLSYFD